MGKFMLTNESKKIRSSIQQNGYAANYICPGRNMAVCTQKGYSYALAAAKHALANPPSRRMSDEIRRGTDLLADSLAHGPRRKIVLESYAPSGVDVKGLVQVGAMPTEGDTTGEDKIVHMHGSIVAFPDACFLWNANTPEDVNLESLAVLRLYQPTVEYLFIGSEKPLPSKEMIKIKKEFRKKDIVVEQLDIMNAMGTFNILNGEDRRVACVLVIDTREDNK
ncbi:hypothetical protein ACHAWF_010135 [Thalassiosira exigua]